MIVSTIFKAVRLPSLGYEKSGSTELRQGSGKMKAITRLRRATIRIKKHQATELREKYFIAFSFDDQLTRATENCLELAALARYGNRSVTVPFVKYSKFYRDGTRIDQNVGTLSRYFDLNTLNQNLDSYDYELLKIWRHFKQSCNQSLDVLLNVLTLHGKSNAPLVEHPKAAAEENWADAM